MFGKSLIYVLVLILFVVIAVVVIVVILVQLEECPEYNTYKYQTDRLIS